VTGSLIQGTATAGSDVDILVERVQTGPGATRPQRDATAQEVLIALQVCVLTSQSIKVTVIIKSMNAVVCTCFGLQEAYQAERVNVTMQGMTKSCKFKLVWPDGEQHSMDVTVADTMFAPVSHIITVHGHVPGAALPPALRVEVENALPCS
jgi:predicted nucleotidyltransferase